MHSLQTLNRVFAIGIGILFLLTSGRSVHAYSWRDGSSETDSGPRKRAWGLSMGYHTHPFPSDYGVGVTYRPASLLRFELQFGKIDYQSSTFTMKGMTYSGEVKVMIIPTWKITPFASGGLTTVQVSTTGTGGVPDFGDLSSSGTAIVIGAGVDVLLDGGFNFGIEGKTHLTQGITAQLIPGGYIGYFF
jgi:hypothetical protein